MHTVAEAAEYLPAAQFSQLDKPDVPWKLPAEQLVHDDNEDAAV